MSTADPPAFVHKQQVAVHRRLAGVMPDGRRGWYDDWSETATIRATQRDRRPLGYWVVRFAHGGELCVDEGRLRPVEAEHGAA